MGRLGNGTEEWQEAPAPILTNVAEAYLGLGSMASAAIKADGIKTDGSLWMWGYNGFKQLPGIEDDYLLSPVKVMDGVASFSMGENHAAALKEDGTLWIWGTNLYNQLGDGTTQDRGEPMKILANVAIPKR